MMTERYKPVTQEHEGTTTVTALADLGFRDGRREKVPGIMKDPLTYARFPLEGQTVYLARLELPFIGEGLAAFLSSVAPFHSQGIGGTIADFSMPVSAVIQGDEQGDGRFNLALHRDHLADPVIGEVYAEFVGNSNDRWALALGNWDPFTELAKHIVVVDAGVLASVYQKIQRFLEYSGDDSSFRSTYELAGYRQLFSLNEVFGAKFDDFLKGKDTITLIAVKEWLSDNTVRSRLKQTSIVTALIGFLKELDREGREQLVLTRLLYEHGVVVDLEQRRVWLHSNELWFKPLFTKDTSVTVIDRTTIALERRIGSRQESAEVTVDRETARVKSSTFKPKLYPVVVWQKDEEGERRFLSQDQLEQIDIESPTEGHMDVFLGRVLVAYLSPQITDAWPDRMTLANRPSVHQAMMGAQVAVWVSIEEHAQQLLSSENPLISTLERHIDSNTTP